MPDVQYVYNHKFAKCFLTLENPFIILKSIIFIFINSISIYQSIFKTFVGILMILMRFMISIFGYAFDMFLRIELYAGEITTVNTN